MIKRWKMGNRLSCSVYYQSYSGRNKVFLNKKSNKKKKKKKKQWLCSFFPHPEFMCDCSTIWSRPIYSRLPPQPPRSLKVTPGDFGRGVLELLCQCEALQWQVCWWGWWLWSRTAPVPPLKHKPAFYAFFQHTESKSSACAFTHKPTARTYLHTHADGF